MNEISSPPKKRQFFGPKAKLIAKLLVTSLLLYLLLSRVDLGLVKTLIPQMNAGILLAAFVLFLGRNVFAALRWQTLLASRDYRIPLTSLVRFYLVGNFIGFILPTAIGGDIARGYYSYKAGISKRESASSVLVERMLGIAAVMVFALAAVLWSVDLIDNDSIETIVIVPSVLGLAALVLFYSSKIDLSATRLHDLFGQRLLKLARLVDSIHQYNQNPMALIGAFLYSVLYQLAGIVSTYLIALAIGSDLAFVYFVALLPVVWLVSMVPVSLNGLGIREGTFVFLFVSVGMAKETAVVISGFCLLQTVAQGLIGSTFFLSDRYNVEAIRQHHQS